MEKTLYLNANSGATVRLDGPSLWIDYPHRSGQRIPGREVSMVVVIGNVIIQAGAITYFANREVPVVFIDHYGIAEAMVLSLSQKNRSHYKEQSELAKSNYFIKILEKVLNEKKLQVMGKVRKKIDKRFGLTVDSDINAINCDYIIAKVVNGDRLKFKLIERIVRSLFIAKVFEQLAKARLDPNIGIFGRKRYLSLVYDIADIFHPEIYLQTIQFFDSKSNEPLIEKIKEGYKVAEVGMRNIVERFENKLAFVNEIILEIIEHIIKQIENRQNFKSICCGIQYENFRDLPTI
jgi:CRISPR/Cas system-associated endonuclease Cas1